MKHLEKSQQTKESTEDGQQPPEEDKVKPHKRAWISLVIIIVVILGAAAAGLYFGRLQLIAYQQQIQTQFSELRDQVQQRVTGSQLDNRLASTQQNLGKTQGRVSRLEQGQQNLLKSTEKLYDLYGRDGNSWKLSEVEYLMSIAQHKLVLEHDFEGAAKTLDAASTLIAELADPGLLPVRVEISEEIAQLKTRARPDLVGMTLLLSRLARQISELKPGYQSKQVIPEEATNKEPPSADPNLPLDQKLKNFVTSLVTIKTSKPEIKKREQTAIIDVTQKLEDNLKLTRWAVLERNAFQFRQLMEQNVDLFEEYYDLDHAANADFYDALLGLQKSSLKPDLPDITGSLRLLREIIKKREGSPQQETDNG
jgi:uroporphyrin-3 C-methyltransferase